MLFANCLKKSILLILILAIVIPLKYGSTNPKYLIVRCLHSILTIKHSFNQSELSPEYRAFETLFRLKPIPKPDPSIDPLPLIKSIRPRFLLGTLIPKSSQCQIKKETIEHDGHTVDTYWVHHHHHHHQTDRIVFYLHGGGFIMGDIHGYSGIECYLSELLNMSIIHIEYRLSPEHHLPAAVDDAIVVYHSLIQKNIHSSQIIIMGDSAGGGLALLTVQKLIYQQLPIPRAIICLSPITDFTMTSESYQRNAHVDVMLSYDYVKWIVRQAIGTQQSLTGPLFNSFNNFPPMYINFGTAEVMEDDSRKLIEKARVEGVDVTFDVGLHMMHGYPAFFFYFPEAQEAMMKIATWIRNV